jgi:hypothetical protein
MFAINDKGRLKVFSSREQIVPAAGWTVIALSNAEIEVKDSDATADNDLQDFEDSED